MNSNLLCFTNVFFMQGHQRCTKRISRFSPVFVDQTADSALGGSASLTNVSLGQTAVGLYLGDDLFPVHLPYCNGFPLFRQTLFRYPALLA